MLPLQGRLLHYFPSMGAADSSGGDWCAWHRDHGSLTGQQLQPRDDPMAVSRIDYCQPN
jgi:hypothetical protein